ncbi:hypothetical protein NDU88_002900 [Pleurodeles waltl]|uniref:Uncharacterized protein n=1 Tax=Pleurodeles waltl TaxID=8319 RepID=A0AAV7M9I6_PLEWA|nr:hypothetical protein NDU88_002900 [Pleurodeles waltl]
MKVLNAVPLRYRGTAESRAASLAAYLTLPSRGFCAALLRRCFSILLFTPAVPALLQRCKEPGGFSRDTRPRLLCGAP